MPELTFSVGLKYVNSHFIKKCIFQYAKLQVGSFKKYSVKK